MHVRGTVLDLPDVAGRYAGHGTGLTRRVLVDGSSGSPHQEVVVGELAAGGRVDVHLHAFEQAFYVLSGALVLDIAGTAEQLEADDYVLLDRGVAHALRNESADAASWFEVSAPRPGGDLDDTVFGDDRALPRPEADPPYRRWHFEESDLPEPSSSIGLAGFGDANVGAAAARVLIGPDTGASQLNLMVVQYGPGGFIKRHDHAFEESFFFLTGEVEADLDGVIHTLRAGEFCWSGVGSMHALVNRGEQPVRWLETQVPQPPSRYQARFAADWERFLAGS